MHLQVHWHRIFAIYFAVAAASLVTACFTSASVHTLFFFMGMSLIVAFVPLIMSIYLMRGFLRIQ